MTMITSAYNGGHHDAERGGVGEGRRQRNNMSRSPRGPPPQPPRRPQQQQWNNNINNISDSDRRYDDRERNMKRPLHQQQQRERYHSNEEPPRQRWKHGHHSSSVPSNNPHHRQQSQQQQALPSPPNHSPPSHSNRRNHDSYSNNDSYNHHHHRRSNEKMDRRDYQRRHDQSNERYYKNGMDRWDRSDTYNNNRNGDQRQQHQPPPQQRARGHHHHQLQQQQYPPARNTEPDRQRFLNENSQNKNGGRWDERQRNDSRVNRQQQEQRERQNTSMSREQHLRRKDSSTSKVTTNEVSPLEQQQAGSVHSSMALHKQSSLSSSSSRNSVSSSTKPPLKPEPTNTSTNQRKQQQQQQQQQQSKNQTTQSSLSVLKRFTSPKTAITNKSKGTSFKKRNSIDRKNDEKKSSSLPPPATIATNATPSSSYSITRTPLKKRWIPSGSSHPSPETWEQSTQKQKVLHNLERKDLSQKQIKKADGSKQRAAKGKGSVNNNDEMKHSKLIKSSSNDKEKKASNTFTLEPSSTSISGSVAEVIAEDESTQPTLETSILEDLMIPKVEGKSLKKKQKLTSASTASKQANYKKMDATIATPDLTEPSTEDFELQHHHHHQQQQQQKQHDRPSEICIPKSVVETVTSKSSSNSVTTDVGVASLPEPSTVVVSESPHSVPAAAEEEEEHDDNINGQLKEHNCKDTSLIIPNKKQVDQDDRYRGGKSEMQDDDSGGNRGTSNEAESISHHSKSATTKKRTHEEIVTKIKILDAVMNKDKANLNNPSGNEAPPQEVAKEQVKPKPQEETEHCPSRGWDRDNAVVDYDSDSSDDSTSSEEDEQEILLWAQKMFGVTPPGLINGRKDGHVVKPQMEERESKYDFDSFDEDSDTTANDHFMYTGFEYTNVQPTAAELVKSRTRKTAKKTETKKFKKKKRKALQEERGMHTSPFNSKVEDIKPVVTKKSRKKSEEQLRHEAEEAKRVKKEAKPLTYAEINAILGEDEFISPTSDWVRRSSRQPSRSAINAPNVRSLTGKLRDNDADMVVLKLKKYISDPDTPQVVLDAVLDALEENTNCEALYIQNFNYGMRDDQVLHLLKILQQPSCRIWCLNIGETYMVKNRTWKAFTRGLKRTKVTHMYASEHTITSEMKDCIRNTIRKNRQKHDMHINPDNLDVIIQCTHCWWNPVNAKCLRPFLQKRGIDHILFDKEVQGLQGSTSGAAGAI